MFFPSFQDAVGLFATPMSWANVGTGQKRTRNRAVQNAVNSLKQHGEGTIDTHHWQYLICKSKNMLTMIGAGTIQHLPSPSNQKMLWISVGLPQMDQTVWFTWISVWFTQFTPLHLIRWGSKTSGLSSTLNYAWSFEVAHFSEEGWRLLRKDLGIPWISLAKWFCPKMYDPTLAFLVVHSSPTKGPALNSCACTVDWNISWWMPLPGFFSVSKRISCFWVFRSMPSFFWYNSWSFPIQFTWLNWTSPNRKRLNMHEKAIAGRIIPFLAQ